MLLTDITVYRINVTVCIVPSSAPTQLRVGTEHENIAEAGIILGTPPKDYQAAKEYNLTAAYTIKAGENVTSFLLLISGRRLGKTRLKIDLYDDSKVNKTFRNGQFRNSISLGPFH